MEVETIADCLNIIVDALVQGVNTIKFLESIHKYLVEKEHRWYIEERIALRNVLKRINYLVGNYKNVAKDVRNECEELRRLTIVWIKDCKTKLEINNQF